MHHRISELHPAGLRGDANPAALQACPDQEQAWAPQPEVGLESALRQRMRQQRDQALVTLSYEELDDLLGRLKRTEEGRRSVVANNSQAWKEVHGLAERLRWALDLLEHIFVLHGFPEGTTVESFGDTFGVAAESILKQVKARIADSSVGTQSFANHVARLAELHDQHLANIQAELAEAQQKLVDLQ